MKVKHIIWLALFTAFTIAFLIEPTIRGGVGVLLWAIWGTGMVIEKRITDLEGMLVMFLVKSNPEVEQIIREAIDKKNGGRS